MLTQELERLGQQKANCSRLLEIGAFGLIGLLAGMALFWLTCDASSKLNRTLWFILLLLGSFYGTHIAYYALVYLPAVVKRQSNPDSEQIPALQMHSEHNRRRIGPFSRTLLVVWGFLLIPVFAALLIPKPSPALSGSVAAAFCVWSAVVVLESAFSAIRFFFRLGMSRPANRDGGKDKS